ncbi:RraA family protein [Alicyclobacillus mengziensis]|uniref:Putative 4-hydroxy-4-methyl-2-oxoglutarate aldolase n=1 Tax=Alicyclobacillus mengziensis TaxID=2931921 RepID=A0A9X7VY97_9BACL|nr:RraA family protein [Alicyclobacillus mengziensis]QSO47263.1 RraA family protein [Alicyclobacillus mengziensis]
MTEKPTPSRANIGTDVPEEVHDVPQVDLSLTRDWVKISGLSATISDILDDLGYALSIPTTELPSRSEGSTIVGRAATIRYLSSRRSLDKSTDGLIHKSAMKFTNPDDVLVIEGDRGGRYSVFGGLAAHSAKKFGIAGLIVDGAVRDIDQIGELGIPVWSRGVTPMTGRGRLQGMGINVPVQIENVQVHPGDVVVADDSGICFVPPEILPEVDRRLRLLIAEEQQIVGTDS